jgi:hypothetical protein
MSLRVVLIAIMIALLPAVSRAQQTCRFTDDGDVRRLENDCQTDRSIDIPDGVTFDGQLHVIEAVDPPNRPFRGAVLFAHGKSASVRNTRITASLVVSACLDGDARLRGIYFDGAAGEIANNEVINIHRLAGDCEEGHAIELRNRRRDGEPVDVFVRKNTIDRYQKAAIVVQGNVDATVEANTIGGSVASPQLAPNGIQIGPQATATVQKNLIAGRFNGQQNGGAAILLFQTGLGTLVEGNAIDGDSDVGIYVFADDATISNNVVRDAEPSGLLNYGIVNQGMRNRFVDNVVVGFRTSYSGVDGGSAPSRGLQIE